MMLLSLLILVAQPMPAIACGPALRDERHSSAGLYMTAAPDAADKKAPDTAAKPLSNNCAADRVKKPQPDDARPLDKLPSVI